MAIAVPGGVRRSHWLFGDTKYISDQDVPGGSLKAMLDLMLKYGKDGILRVHVAPGVTILIVSNPGMVWAHAPAR